MHKVQNTKYRERYAEKTLDNGLHVVIWEKPDYEKSLFMMATPLGALDMRQVDEAGNTYSFPSGIAHFLEHKMFEMPDGDIMEAFSRMGANVNAFTSYTETVYYFTTSADIEAPLHLLLDFVQELHITDESVEKEKGIILQELNMYRQMSDSRLLMETYSSLYQEHPLRFDIGGDDESVRMTTREQLMECYALNYHPQRMVLVGVTAQDCEQVLKIVEDNQAKKQFPPMRKVKRQMIKEPQEVCRQEYRFAMDINIPKVAVAYKLTPISSLQERLRREWSIRMMLDVVFSSLNPDFQTWIDAGIINDFVGCDIDYGEDHGMLLFYGESGKEAQLLQLLEQVAHKVQQGQIDDVLLAQLKRRYYGQTIRSLNSFDDIAISYVRNYFDGCDFFASLDILDSLTKADIQQACKALSLAQRCVVTVVPENCKPLDASVEE